MPKQRKEVVGVYERELGSDIWHARYKVKGKLVRKFFGPGPKGYKAAVAWVEKARTIRLTGGGVLPTTAKRPVLTTEELTKIGEVTVGELCNAYLTHIQDPHNPERPTDQVNPPHRIEVIKDAFGDRPAASVEPHEIGDWLRGLKRKPGTLNRYKSTLSAIYNYGKERKQVKTNPVRDVKHFKVALPNPRFMDDDEETKLRKVVQGWIDSTPERHKLTRLFLREHLNEITVGAGTGIRKANQYGLMWAMLDLKHRLIHLPNTKTGVPHTVPMIDDVYDALVDQKAIQEEIAAIQRKLVRPDGTVASRRVAGDRVFSITENREWFDKAKDDAGISDLRWHDLSRHTAGSRLAQSGANLKVIQEVLGHATITMSARYSHLNKEHLAESMKALNRQR